MPAIRDLRVLLVDDDLMTLECFNLYLRKQDADVRTASSVHDALDQIESWLPNFVVTDLGLPGEDGFSLIQRMRAHESTRGVPVIIMTGYEVDSINERMRGDHSVTTITKPVDPEDLLTLIQKLSA